MAEGTAERRAAAKAAPSDARFQNVDVNTCRSLPERRAEGGLCRPQWHPSGDRNPDEHLGFPTPKNSRYIPSKYLLSQLTGLIVGFVLRIVKLMAEPTLVTMKALISTFFRI
jgi:hypothetical protein